MILTAGCLATGGLLQADETIVSKDKPNIIWLMAEDMGQDLECYGMKGVKTPNLNKLAKEGVLYNNCFVTNPICSPSRSSMMTGVHQNVINAQHHRSNRNVPLMAPYKPITYWLRKKGYTSILGNKDVFMKGMKIDCNFKCSALGPYDGVKKFGLFDKKLDFTTQDAPFFNQVQLKVTHRGDWWNGIRKKSKHPVKLDEIELPPYMVDTKETRYDWACYLDTVEYMDNEVGNLMADIRKKALEKNTIVIFIADNGRCNIRGKGYLYEPGVRVPLIVWAPGRVKAGTVNNDFVTTIDISASVLQLAGAEIPDYMTARPFIGLDKVKSRKYIRTARDIWDEIDECSRGIRTEKFSYIINHMPQVPWDAQQGYLDLNRPAVHVMRSLMSKRKLSAAESVFLQNKKPQEELYDLQKDPHQLNNLAANPEYKEVLEDMRLKEKEWLSKNKDYGLEDLGKRKPAVSPAAKLCTYLKEERPEIWKRYQAGELMEAGQFKKGNTQGKAKKKR